MNKTTSFTQPGYLASIFAAVCICISGAGPAHAAIPPKDEPVRIIFDTDLGNDVDDVLALAMIHALADRVDCELLAVTCTKPSELAVPLIDAINRFYGRPVPMGITRQELKDPPGKFLAMIEAREKGKVLYPHRVKRSSQVPFADQLLRKILSSQPDQSIVMVQVGYFSNLAVLLETPGDEISPLTGRELVRRKVRLLSVMAGGFDPGEHRREYNVIKDLPAAKKVSAEWPTPIVWSGHEIGRVVPYPASSIRQDYSYVPHHPVAEAYYLYEPPPHERPTWDLTSVLYAVYPERGYFGLSEPGSVTVEADGFTKFMPSASGRDRYLTLNEVQIARVKEAFVQLSSRPPRGFKAKTR